MKARLFVVFSLVAGVSAFGFAPTDDQCAVNVRYDSADGDVLVVEGETYTLELGVEKPRILSFFRDGQDQLGRRGAWPEVNDKPIQGPGRINIYRFGTVMYEVHLRDLEVDGLDADVELALYCYGKRVFANLNVIPRAGVPLLATGWQAHYRTPGVLATSRAAPEAYREFVMRHRRYPHTALFSQNANPAHVARARAGLRFSAYYCATTLPAVAGTPRTECLVFCAAGDGAELHNMLRVEAAPESLSIQADGARVDGYQPTKGYFQLTTEFRGPRSFEEAWINPNQRYEVALHVSRDASEADWTDPSEIVCNVRNTYGVLEAAVLTDADGYPLPVPVQVCKNFGGEKEEGAEEGDTPFGEAYFPVTVGRDEPFDGRLYHLFGNWGTHPLKQISSIRFFHHYFHASLGPTETFCYTPFEYPRDDGRNYILADVRGLSNFAWSGQPQHHHASVVGALRYKSKGEWVNNVLQDTRIYLTAPNVASFALDYLSEDGKVKTTLEIFELPQDDEARCFIKMAVDVLEPVLVDGDSAQNLRFLNAGAYIVRTLWPQVAYTAADGETAIVDVPADGTWALEAAPLGSEHPFCAAYPHANGNMAFFVNRFEGVLGGVPVDSFGLSCFGGKQWTEMFLTAPGSIEQLEKGDHIEAHLFVMPYGHADVDYKPAERQRELYGAGLASVEVHHGTALPGFPRRVRADERGFAEFTLTGGDNWTPILVEGFSSHRGLMLWENRGSWLFHDQQVHGNDWYQTYRAQDGSVGFVIVVKVRPGQAHRYLVTTAPHAKTITQRNGFVTVTGGPMDFLSPVKFGGVACSPLADTGLYQCTGEVEKATVE